MGTKQTTVKCNFEDVQKIMRNERMNGILINTLPNTEQDCLIYNTVSIDDEVTIINDSIQKNTDKLIIVYGRNSNDSSIFKKYNQLIELGFKHVLVYTGGMFEWLCLQDIYGDDEFPTTKKEIDILRYKTMSVFNTKLLTN